MQIVVGDELRYLQSRCSSKKQLEYDCTNRVNVTKLSDLFGLHILFENHEFLYVISLFVDKSIFLHDDSAQIVTDLHLLW